MSGSQELFSAINELLKNTARFVPAAFHIHSPASHDWPRPAADLEINDRQRFLSEGGEDAFVRCLAQHYRIVCITDHMKTRYACRLAAAATKRNDLTVFPGMEVSCRIGAGIDEQVHVLVIFPPDRDFSAIERIFSGGDLPGEPTRNGTEEFRLPCSFAEWSQRVRDEGGLVIPAHVDQRSRGHRAHFRAMRDASVRMLVLNIGDERVIDEQREIAAEYRSALLESGVDAIEIMKSEDRQHYVNTQTADGRPLTLPCVIRSDHHCIEDLRNADRTTYLKVSRLDFGSLKQALEFHETRIKFQPDLLPSPSPRLIGIHICSPGNGLFKDAIIAFNENLNCLIGPRGSGKVTV